MNQKKTTKSRNTFMNPILNPSTFMNPILNPSIFPHIIINQIDKSFFTNISVEYSIPN